MDRLKDFQSELLELMRKYDLTIMSNDTSITGVEVIDTFWEGSAENFCNSLDKTLIEAVSGKKV
jgi:hypothetical protein